MSCLESSTPSLGNQLSLNHFATTAYKYSSYIRPVLSYPSSPSHLHKSTATEQYTLAVNAYKHNNDVEHEDGMYA